MEASKVTPDTNDDIVQPLIGINKTASLHRTYEISFFSTPEFFNLGQKKLQIRRKQYIVQGIPLIVLYYLFAFIKIFSITIATLYPFF